MPFVAEDLYQKIKTEKDKESVHLEKWPIWKVESGKWKVESLIEDMRKTRHVVSLGLEERARAGIKVRQPLLRLSTKIKFDNEYAELIKDELNVKEVCFEEKIEGDIKLDVTITSELKEEGQVREFIRAVQDLRKKEKLNPKDIVSLSVSTNENGKSFVEKWRAEISQAVNIKGIDFSEDVVGEEVSFSEMSFVLKLII